jgi:hypothetical protein
MFSTKNVSSNRTSPVIGPGNHKVKINSISFDPTSYDPEAINITLNVETEPIEGEFQGFLIDPSNTNGPRYKGQVGRVKMSPYAYKDADLQNGRKVKRDEEIVKAIAFLADVTNKRDEVDMIEAQTMTEFANACKQIFANTDYINACIGGREWENNDGYINIDLHLPRLSKAGVPLESLESKANRLLKFNYDDHVKKIVKKESSEVNSFEPFNKNSSSDFDL